MPRPEQRGAVAASPNVIRLTTLTLTTTWREKQIRETGESRGRPQRACYYAGGVKEEVRVIPAARPFAAITNAILRDASSIISSPSITAPSFPPASEV